MKDLTYGLMYIRQLWVSAIRILSHWREIKSHLLKVAGCDGMSGVKHSEMFMNAVFSCFESGAWVRATVGYQSTDVPDKRAPYSRRHSEHLLRGVIHTPDTLL